MSTSPIPYRRLVLLGISLAIPFVTAMLVPAESEALPCNYEYRYYSNSSYTLQIGAQGNRPLSCGCTSYKWGQLSAYRLSGSSSCLEP